MRLDARAACSACPALWFAENKSDRKTAKRTCVERCPARQECGLDAHDTGEKYGIRAGFDLDTSSGRRALRVWLGVEKTKTPSRTCACGREFAPPKPGSRMCVPCAQGLVDIDPVRTHLELLLGGMSSRELSARTGLPRVTIRQIANNSDRLYVKRRIADRLLGVQPPVEAVPA